MLTAGAGAFIAVPMGVVSATFGVMRDILAGESPLILRKEIYVTGGTRGCDCVRWALGAWAPGRHRGGCRICRVLPRPRARALYGWSLPVYRARAGRTVEEVERLGRDKAERR